MDDPMFQPSFDGWKFEETNFIVGNDYVKTSPLTYYSKLAE